MVVAYKLLLFFTCIAVWKKFSFSLKIVIFEMIVYLIAILPYFNHASYDNGWGGFCPTNYVLDILQIYIRIFLILIFIYYYIVREKNGVKT